MEKTIFERGPIRRGMMGRDVSERGRYPCGVARFSGAEPRHGKPAGPPAKISKLIIVSAATLT